MKRAALLACVAALIAGPSLAHIAAMPGMDHAAAPPASNDMPPGMGTMAHMNIPPTPAACAGEADKPGARQVSDVKLSAFRFQAPARTRHMAGA